MKKRVAAFTLLEVTIAMLLAAIVISIAYTALHIITSTYRSYQQKEVDKAAYKRLDQLLSKDFFMPGLVYETEDGIRLKFSEGQTSYQFNQPDSSVRTFIIRSQFSAEGDEMLVTDTFRLVHSNMKQQFEGKKVKADMIIDQLDLNLHVQGKTIPIRYHKIYSANELMQSYANN